jgi:hypothetical protein
MSQNHGDVGDLHALLFQLISLVDQSSPHPTHHEFTHKPHKSHFNTTPHTHVTESDDLPQYGLGPIETYAKDFLGIEKFKTAAECVQAGHEITGPFKFTPEFKTFMQKMCGVDVPKGQSLHVDHTTLENLGSPVVEQCLILYQYHKEFNKSLLPPAGSTVITSVATAGSGGVGEWRGLFNAIFGSGSQYYHLLELKTILDSGVTGRTSETPLDGDVCIRYNENAPRSTWAAVSEDLYQQLSDKSNLHLKPPKLSDAIFHWGCISHHDTMTPKGPIEDWAHHEHWNMLYCIAMARHALNFLKPGGTLVLKVRIFKETRTLALVALLSCAFNDFRIYSNPRMPAEFATFIGIGFQGSHILTVQRVKDILSKGTQYSHGAILCHALTAHSTYQKTLARAEEVQKEMQRNHDSVAWITNYIIYWIYKARYENHHFPYENLESKLEILHNKTYVPVVIDREWIPDVTKRIADIIKTLTPEQANIIGHYVRTFSIEKLMA